MVRLAPLLALFIAVSLLLHPGDLGDERDYLRFASNLLEGSYASPPGPNAVAFLWHGPGLPLLLTPLAALDAPLELSRLLLGPLPLFLAVVLFERLLRLYVDERWALGGAYALGLYVPLYGYLPVLHKEPLALLCVIAAAYCSVLLLRSGRRRYALGAGLALGWLALTRLEYGWVVLAGLALTVVWALLARGSAAPRRLAAAYAIALLLCVPWLAYTYSQTERPLYWGNSGGLSLYWTASTGPGEWGDWHAVHSVLADPELAAHRPLFQRLRRVPPLERDLTLQRIALERIRAEPWGYLRNAAANGSRMWLAMPYSFRRPGVATLLYAALNLAVLALLAVALARLRRRGGPGEEGLALLQLGGLAFGVHLIVAADPRMLMPIVPLVLLAIVRGLARAPGPPGGGAPGPSPGTRAADGSALAASSRRPSPARS